MLWEAPNRVHVTIAILGCDIESNLNEKQIGIVHVCIVHICICIFFVLQEGGGGSLRCTVCTCIHAYGEILTTLFTGLGYARSVSEHTCILMIDTMYTVP